MAHAREQIAISNDVRYAEVAAMFFYEMNGTGKSFGEFLIGDFAQKRLLFAAL
jgi:hypothetical protein